MGPSIVRAEPSSAAARRAMVDNQIRTFDVTDQRVLGAFETVPRELFLPDALADLAYSDAVLTLDSGDGARRVAFVPMVLARMLQGADIAADDVVLVIGGASGYAALLAAELSAHVTALESSAAFTAEGVAHAASLGMACRFVTGDLASGWSAGAPYSAILVCGAVETNLDQLFAQLAPNGRLVAVSTAAHQATRRSGKVVRFDKFGPEMSSRVLFDATLPVLDAFKTVPAFSF